MVWEPWDATEEEVVELRTVRDLVPRELRPALRRWLRHRLATSGGSWVLDRQVHLVQSSLRLDLSEFERGGAAEDILDFIEEEHGDKMMVRVADLALAQIPVDPLGNHPDAVVELVRQLDLTSAAVGVSPDSGRYRIVRRLPEGVEEAAQAGVDAGGAGAGRHLALAIDATRGVDPNPSLAMAEAIKAVEGAAGPVVMPTDRRAPRLGKIVQTLRDKRDWDLRFGRRDDDVPDHRQVLIGMLETLTYAQTDRHTGPQPSPEEAQSHVMLASTLVEWFSSGTVVMNIDS